MIHALITFALASAAFPFGWHHEVAALIAAFYAGIEHAQAEYRAIKGFYGGKRANAHWWCGLEPRVWDKKSMLDWIGPMLVVIVASFV